MAGKSKTLVLLISLSVISGSECYQPHIFKDEFVIGNLMSYRPETLSGKNIILNNIN